jgi:hypothetical protein
MAHSYNGNASNVTGATQVTITQPDDGDPDNASAQNTPSSKLADFAQKFLAFVNGLFSTANTWTALQTFQGASGSAGINATGNGSGAGGTFTGGTFGGDGVDGQGGGSGAGGSFTGGSGGGGPGVIGTGGSGGPGAYLTAGSGRGAAYLAPQATPGSPANGDVWVDTTKESLSAKVNGAVLSLTPQSGPNVVGSFGTNWSANVPVRYYIDSDGYVHLAGEVKCSSTGPSTAFTLPSGFRPTSQVNSGLYDTTAGSMTAYSITTGGAVGITEPNANDVLCLDGIVFPTF